MAISIRSQWNRANAVTTARIAIIPFFVWALLADDGSNATWRYVATAIFALAAGTDKVDGYLARKYNLITDLGKLLDPIADKALIGAALVGLCLIGDLPWWVTIVILARELGITIMRFIMLKHVVLPASRGGKWKTAVQVGAIGLFLLPLWTFPDFVTVIAIVLMGLAIAVTLATGVDYVVRAMAITRAPGYERKSSDFA